MVDQTKDMVGSWRKRCLTPEQAYRKIEQEMEGNHDEYVSCLRINLINDKGRLQLAIKGMNDYDFTRGSLSQLAGPNYLGLGCRLFDIGRDDFEQERIQELYIHRWEEYQKNNENRQQFLRLRNDGTVRAFLSGQYKPINHLWLADRLFDYASENDMVRLVISEGGDNIKLDLIDAESMQELVDASDSYGDVDNNNKNGDDVFGKMISCSNSEVGNGRLSINPSIYRCICSNGLIMSMQDIDANISVVHKGKKDLNSLETDIWGRLKIMSKYVTKGLGNLLQLKSKNYLCIGATEEQVICQIGKDFGLIKQDRFELFKCLSDEPEIIRTGAYACINALTRYVNDVDDPNNQEEIEIAAGQYLNSWADDNKGVDNWQLLNKQASRLNVGAELGLAV